MAEPPLTDRELIRLRQFIGDLDADVAALAAKQSAKDALDAKQVEVRAHVAATWPTPADQRSRAYQDYIAAQDPIIDGLLRAWRSLP